MHELISLRNLFAYAFEYSTECYVLTGKEKDVYIVIFQDEENQKSAIYISEYSIMRMFSSRKFNINDIHSGDLSKWIENSIHEIMMDNFGERVDSVKLFVDAPIDTIKPELRLV